MNIITVVNSFTHDVLKVQFLQVANIFIPIAIIHHLKLNVLENLTIVFGTVSLLCHGLSVVSVHHQFIS